jgi:hypothetical protein
LYRARARNPSSCNEKNRRWRFFHLPNADLFSPFIKFIYFLGNSTIYTYLQEGQISIELEVGKLVKLLGWGAGNERDQYQPNYGTTWLLIVTIGKMASDSSEID